MAPTQACLAQPFNGWGTEESNRYSFLILSKYKTFTVCAHFCMNLFFMFHHTFPMRGRSGLLGGQLSTLTVCLQSFTVVTHAESDLALL